MGIKTQISRIKQNIANAYAVLSALGADMPDEQSSDNLAQTAGTAKAVLYSQQTLTEAQQAQARENVGAASAEEVDELSDKIDNLTLGVHTDGLVYIFKDGAPIGNGVQVGTDGDVVGYVDSDNNIVVKGNLADGTYSVKYEMADGSTIDIGDLVLDTNVYYSITNNLTNCTNSNSDTQVVEGQSYTATITAFDGYELSSVLVTMGGSPVSVSGGVISIANVTGNIVITAVAEEAVVEIVNQIPLSVDTDGTIYNGTGYKTPARISSSGAIKNDVTGVSATGFISVKTGDKVFLKGMYVAGDVTGYTQIAVYDANKSSRIAFYAPTNSYASEGNDVYSHTITETDAAFIRASVYKIMDGSEIITVNQPIV